MDFSISPPALTVLLLLTGSASALATGWVRDYARRNLMDVPNDRSSHTVPTPRGGGLAIVAVYSVAMAGLAVMGSLPSGWPAIYLGGLAIAAIGFWDDHGDVSALPRLAVQLAVSAWAVYLLGGWPELRVDGLVLPWGMAGGIAGVLFLAWMINLFNFMDGIDGIAAGEAITTAGGAAALLGFAGLSAGPDTAQLAALACAVAGFLVWNWPPARIFMGDVGSGFLGYLLGVSALYSATHGELSLTVWLILLGIFVTDATLTLLRRMSRGERWYAAHRSHAYQRASRRFGGHRPVTLAVLGINLAWLLPIAFLAQRFPYRETTLLLIAYVPLILAARWLDAGESKD